MLRGAIAQSKQGHFVVSKGPWSLCIKKVGPSGELHTVVVHLSFSLTYNCNHPVLHTLMTKESEQEDGNTVQMNMAIESILWKSMAASISTKAVTSIYMKNFEQILPPIFKAGFDKPSTCWPEIWIIKHLKWLSFTALAPILEIDKRYRRELRQLSSHCLIAHNETFTRRPVATILTSGKRHISNSNIG